VLFLLACAVFAQAVSEFVLAGLLPAVAADLDVSLAAAGALTSAFAVGMVVGAPVMALVARRLPARSALAGFLAVFVVAHVVGALTSAFAVLLCTRVLAALANAGFLAVALSAAVRLSPGRPARATSILLAGTTLALVAGVPLGALLGAAAGWRSTFWVVAALTLPALVGVLRLPAGSASAMPDVRTEVRGLRPAVPTLVLAVLVNGGTFAVLTYLAVLVTPVPLALASFGTGAFVGVAVAGRLADTRFRTLLTAGLPMLLATWIALALWPSVPLVGMAGALAFALGSGAVARSLALADAPSLGGGAATAALNVGAVVGPLLGGVSLTLGPAGPAVVAGALVALAVALTTSPS
jgi:MFS transporter, DHA1 family, chloramphenicol resistance protein